MTREATKPSTAKPWATGEEQKDRYGPSWRFLVASGSDGTAALHRALKAMQAAAAIGTWYDVGSVSDNEHCYALIEFERETDGMAAVLSWDAPS